VTTQVLRPEILLVVEYDPLSGGSVVIREDPSDLEAISLSSIQDKQHDTEITNFPVSRSFCPNSGKAYVKSLCKTIAPAEGRRFTSFCSIKSKRVF
jgi:hypothetical protein